MFTTIINDCRDDNASGRQTSRAASLLHTNVAFVGVESDLEAGLQLIDILDATEGRPGLILANVAPRGGHTKQWENGTPFALFHYQETLIITTVDGYALSGVKKLDLVKEVSLVNIHSACLAMTVAGLISEAEAERIPTSQFRSLDFIPRLGAYLLEGNQVPTTPYTLSEVPDLPAAIWHIDCFGNCKTTITKKEIDTAGEIQTRFGSLPYVEHLRDVPDRTEAMITGSSGLGNNRWIELVIQNDPFADTYQAAIGDSLFDEESYYRSATGKRE